MKQLRRVLLLFVPSLFLFGTIACLWFSIGEYIAQQPLFGFSYWLGACVLMLFFHAATKMAAKHLDDKAQAYAGIVCKYSILFDWHMLWMGFVFVFVPLGLWQLHAAAGAAWLGIVACFVLFVTFEQLFSSRYLAGSERLSLNFVEKNTEDRLEPITPTLEANSQGSRRKYVICIDGTWNAPTSQTNVHRLFKSLGEDSETQIRRYYNGVGTEENAGVALRVFDESVTTSIISGALASDQMKIRRRVYAEFVRDYRLGDQVYLFGFSRGAAIARMLANDILNYGIPELVEIKTTKSALSKTPVVTACTVVGPKKNSPDGVDIAMMGLWDTVGAFPFLRRYKNLTVGPHVKRAFHLIALDEKRRTFDVTMMGYEKGRIDEIWFAGAHSDVGGGSGNLGLNDVSLRFMMLQAKDLGIEFTQDAIENLRPNACAEDHWHAPRAWRILGGWKYRDIHWMKGADGNKPQLHRSVIDRIGAGKPCRLGGTAGDILADFEQRFCIVD